MVAYRKRLRSKPHTVAPSLQISLYTRISLWNIRLISTRWNFLENRVGDVYVNVLICNSHNDCQWRVGLMQSAGQKPPQKPPGFQLTSALEIWWANLCFSYCSSHFSYQNSGCEDLLQFLYVQWNIVVVCLLGEMCVRVVALSAIQRKNHLFLVTHFAIINHQDETTVHTQNQHIQSTQICHYLKFTKKGKWKHSA